MKIFLTTLVLFAFSVCCFGQGQNDNWCLERGKGIKFINGTLTQFTNGLPQNTDESIATISDRRGNLLFYTAQFGGNPRVYNRNHVIMNNGVGLNGGLSIQQGLLIVPNPQDSNIYYLFHLSGINASSLFYSIVDMRLNGGLGDVIQKNIPIMPGTIFNESLTACYQANRTDFWVVAHDGTTNEFYTFSVDANGFNAIPIISSSGSTNIPLFVAGECSISNNQCFISQVFRMANKVELLAFDYQTGMVGNVLFSDSVWAPWGVAFSPDDTRLYLTHSAPIPVSQYDLSLGNAQAIVSSRTAIVEPKINSTFNIETGPDQKLYFIASDRRVDSFPSIRKLMVINDPNKLGLNCDVQFANYPPLYINQFALPNMFNLGSENKFCKEDTLVIQPPTPNPLACLVVLPNAFSPNKDSKNETFGPINRPDINLKHFLIYNRWGQQVYHTTNIQDRWDGSFDGQPAHADVYYYSYKYFCNTDKKEMQKKGDVTLVR